MFSLFFLYYVFVLLFIFFFFFFFFSSRRRHTRSYGDWSSDVCSSDLTIPVCPYMLEATLPGFKTYVQTGIVLQVDSNPSINVVLQIGQISDQIEEIGRASCRERV